jgi:hypothetical protein
MYMVFGSLEVTNHTGISIGAVHWYGKLWIDDLSDNPNGDYLTLIELERKMTGAERRTLNLEAGSTIFLKGATTEGFMTKEDAIAAGLKRFRSQYKGVLFLGSMADRSAWKEVLYCPPHLQKIADQMNALGKRFRSLNGYEGRTPIRVERLDKKWGRLYNTLRLECKMPTH